MCQTQGKWADTMAFVFMYLHWVQHIRSLTFALGLICKIKILFYPKKCQIRNPVNCKKCVCFSYLSWFIVSLLLSHCFFYSSHVAKNGLLCSGHPYFVGVQFHPEYISRPLRPSPPYLGLILASIGKLQAYIARGCRLSPRCSISEDEDEEFDVSALKM